MRYVTTGNNAVWNIGYVLDNKCRQIRPFGLSDDTCSVYI